MENEKPKSMFEMLNELNVNEHIEKRKQNNKELSYLSWAWAWAYFKKQYPDATYTIYKNENNQPYFEDPDFGIMCYTTVTAGGLTHEMWLPVMDGANKAMRRTSYTYETKFGEKKTVVAATMFDINKTIMRCLVKNIAMFGLGLYIYSGEDLPDVTEEEPAPKPKAAKAAPKAEPKPAPKPAEPVQTEITSQADPVTEMQNKIQTYKTQAELWEFLKTDEYKNFKAQHPSISEFSSTYYNKLKP